MIILESKFELVNGEVVNFNVHEDIKNYSKKFDSTSLEHFKRIDNEISELKAKGFDVIYTLKLDPRVF